MVQVEQKKDDATIIILAYPHELVATTPSLYSYALPLIGMGNSKYIRAGHAAMVLVKDNSDEFEYYDLGRYVTPRGYSRVRSADTDPELIIDVTPQWGEDNALTNVDELLQWLGANPHKTRGEGTLYASVCEGVNYGSVKRYIADMQGRGLVGYGPFRYKGSNCTRFVGNVLRNGVLSEEAYDRVDKQFNLTPSVLGLVAAGNSYDYHYEATSDTIYTSTKNLAKLQKKFIFDWGRGDYKEKCRVNGNKRPHPDVEAGENWRWLVGTSCGAWFHIEETANKLQYLISKYDERGRTIYKSLFASPVEVDVDGNFTMDYLSDYKEVNILLECGTRISFERLPDTADMVGILD